MRWLLIIFGIIGSAAVIGSWVGGSGGSDSGSKVDHADTAASQPTEQSVYLIGSRVQLIHPFYGCLKQDDLDKVREMLRANDREAMVVAAERGECLELQVGTEGVVRDLSVWHGSTCIRPAGNPDCVWVPTFALANAAPEAGGQEPEGQAGADEPRCKAVLSRMLATTQAKVNRRSRGGDNVFVDVPDAQDGLLECPSPPLRYSISAAAVSGHPSTAYFKFIAMAGAALTGAPATSLTPLIEDCQKKAHASQDENDEEDLPIAEIDCTSFDRDGGGTSISIYEPRAVSDSEQK